MEMQSNIKTAISAYLAAEPDTAERAEAFEAVEQWVAAEYEAEGLPESELARIDYTAIAHAYIDRARVP
jgi:hypothetical protein